MLNSARTHGRLLSRNRARVALALVAIPMALFIGAAQRAQGAGTPDQIGQFGAPFDWPNVAVHVMLEPNGTVLSIDAWADAPNKQYIYNPTTGTFTLSAYARNLFCSGHTQLGNGKTLIVGGNEEREQRDQGHDGLRLDEQLLDARARHGGRPLVPDRDGAVGRPRLRLRAATTSTRPGRPCRTRSRRRRSTRSRRSTTPSTNTLAGPRRRDG